MTYKTDIQEAHDTRLGQVCVNSFVKCVGRYLIMTGCFLGNQKRKGKGKHMKVYLCVRVSVITRVRDRASGNVDKGETFENLTQNEIYRQFHSSKKKKIILLMMTFNVK